MKKNTDVNTLPKKEFTELQKDILASLVYFNIFQFPLKQSEIQNLLKNHFSTDIIDKALSALLNRGTIFTYDGYFSCEENLQSHIKNRIKNERATGHFFGKLPLYVRILSRFPFVRAVAISGSLSKGVLHQDGDIDYFIITETNRLWLARTFIIFFKKVFLFNSKKYFCANYFITQTNLTLEDQNRFTATEIAYLIPVYNAPLIQEFKKANNWLHKYYGHFSHPIKLKEQKQDWGILKRTIERLLNNPFGDWLDVFFMKITVRKWKAKFGDFSSDKFELTMRTRNNVSKHHPQDFQTKVLDKFNAEYNAIVKN